MNTIVDTTKLKKKSPIYQMVDIEAEIDNIEPGPLTGKESWTRGAEIYTYDESQKKRSPQTVVMTMMRQQANKYYKKAEKTSAKFMDNNGRSSIARKAKMVSFFFMLDMMLIEVQNTIMYLAFNK